MAFFMDPGAMFLGCLGPSEQKFLVTLIETAAKSGYTKFVEPCAGTFAMANLAVQNGFKPEQIETSDVNMMSTVLGYAITGQSLEHWKSMHKDSAMRSFLILQQRCTHSCISEHRRTQGMIISTRYSRTYGLGEKNT